MARMPRHWLSATIGRLWAGPPHPVSRRLRDGDRVGSFTVIETPGHTVGHISYLARVRPCAGGRGRPLQSQHLHRPGYAPPTGTDIHIRPGSNRASARRLGALEPKLICFGHGPPLRDTARFVKYVHSLPNPLMAARRPGHSGWDCHNQTED